jgi:hypothetical protein
MKESVEWTEAAQPMTLFEMYYRTETMKVGVSVRRCWQDEHQGRALQKKINNKDQSLPQETCRFVCHPRTTFLLLSFLVVLATSRLFLCVMPGEPFCGWWTTMGVLCIAQTSGSFLELACEENKKARCTSLDTPHVYTPYPLSPHLLAGGEFQQINAALKGLQAIFPEEIVVDTLEFPSQEEYLAWLENNKRVRSPLTHQTSQYFAANRSSQSRGQSPGLV